MLLLVALLLSIASLGIVTFAKLRLTSISDQVILVSSRPKVEDGLFIVAAKDRAHFLYLRSEESFSKALAAKYPASPQEGRNFYRSVSYRASGALPVPEGRDRAEMLVRLNSLAEEFPTVIMAIGIGLGLGLVFPLGSSAVLPVLVLSALVSLLKFYTACPTCPKATIAGIDAALLGTIVLSLAAIVWTLWRDGSRCLRATCLGLLCGLSTLWQIVSWWDLKPQCLPCTILGLLFAWMLSSVPRLSDEPRGRLLAVRPSLASCVAFALLGAYVAPASAESSSASQSLIAFGQPRDASVSNVRELGLQPARHRQVLLVASRGCHACEKVMASLDGAGIKGLGFLYVGSLPPDSLHLWRRVDPSAGLYVTPLTLLVEPDGRVSRTISGFGNDPDHLAAYFQDISPYLPESRLKP